MPLSEDQVNEIEKEVLGDLQIDYRFELDWTKLQVEAGTRYTEGGAAALIYQVYYYESGGDCG